MGQSIFERAMPQASAPAQIPVQSGMQFANPIQKAKYVMQAMTNPAAFVKQHFPDIPNEMMNDPGRIMQYLQQTRGISQQDIQNTQNEMQQGGIPWRR